jgi:hypothetical protein
MDEHEQRAAGTGLEDTLEAAIQWRTVDDQGCA